MITIIKIILVMGEIKNLKNVYEFQSLNGELRLQIVFRLTFNCNQRCVFCNVVEGKNSIEKDVLGIRIKRELLSTIKEYSHIPLNNIEIVLSGGEPTLYKNFWEILDFFLEHAGKVVIQTNGVMFSSQKYVESLQQRKNKNIGFYISFHSHIEDIYNKITKTDQYQSAITGIKNILRNAGHKVELNFVFNKYNIDTFGDYIRFIKKFFLSLYKNISINISAVTGVSETDDLVSYTKILNNVYAAYDYIKDHKIFLTGLTPGGALCDIPFCVYEKYTSLSKELSGKKLFTFESIDSNNVKLKSCSQCHLNKHCPGILKAYIQKFGAEEFQPFLGTIKTTNTQVEQYTNVEVLTLIENGKYKEARKLLKKIEIEELGYIEFMARIFFGEKKYELALEYFLKLERLLGEVDYSISYLIGVTYDNLGEKENAQKYIQRSLDLNSGFEYAKEYMLLLTQQKKTSTIESHDGNLPLWAEISQLINEKRYEEAEQRLNSQEGRKIDLKMKLELESRTQFGLKNYEAALELYSQLNTLMEKPDYNVMYMIGVLHDNLGNEEEAKKFFTKTLELCPDFQYAKEYLEKIEVREQLQEEKT